MSQLTKAEKAAQEVSLHWQDIAALLESFSQARVREVLERLKKTDKALNGHIEPETVADRYYQGQISFAVDAELRKLEKPPTRES